MKYVILGGVAAGTKAAAKLKRCDRNAEVKVFTKGEDISYAGCVSALLYRRRYSLQRRTDRKYSGKIFRPDRSGSLYRLRGHFH